MYSLNQYHADHLFRQGAGSAARTMRSEIAKRTTVLFACVHNAGRSQMAEAFFNALADPARARAVSAGTRAADRIHPVVVDAMREIGIDLGGRTPQRLTPSVTEGVGWLVTMGCGESCPVVPGARVEDWPVADPAGEPLHRVREIRDDVRARVKRFIERERL